MKIWIIENALAQIRNTTSSISANTSSVASRRREAEAQHRRQEYDAAHDRERHEVAAEGHAHGTQSHTNQRHNQPVEQALPRRMPHIGVPLFEPAQRSGNFQLAAGRHERQFIAAPARTKFGTGHVLSPHAANLDPMYYSARHFAACYSSPNTRCGQDYRAMLCRWADAGIVAKMQKRDEPCID
jgi:hypothetical protein